MQSHSVQRMLRLDAPVIAVTLSQLTYQATACFEDWQGRTLSVIAIFLQELSQLGPAIYLVGCREPRLITEIDRASAETCVMPDGAVPSL